MAPTLDVEIRDLVVLTRDLVEVGDTCAALKEFVADAQIATSNWPAAGWGTAHAYKKASTTAADAMGAAHDAGTSTAESLDAVARHYAGAEYHSSLTSAAPPPPPGSETGLTSANGARLAFQATEGAVAGLLLLHLTRARASIGAAAGPVGLLPMVLAIDALTVEPNIREAGPFRDAGAKWNVIATKNIKPMREELSRIVPLRSWDGTAAASFNAHMRDRFLPALERLETLATSMGGLCDDMATGMEEINKQWLALLLKTTISLLLLNLVPLPYRPMFSIAAISGFIANVGWLYWKMRNWFSAKASDVAEIEKEAAALAADCFDDSQALEAKRNLLNPHFTMVSDTWSTDDWLHNWQYTGKV